MDKDSPPLPQSHIHEAPERARQALYVIAGLIGIGFIAWLNFQIIQGWFDRNLPANLASIEVSYITMARFLVDFAFKSWLPIWYFGFPTHVIYTPLVPYLEAILHALTNMPYWQTYRFLTGWAFILAPISVTLLAWQLSRSVFGGLIAGAIYTVIPSPFNFMLSSGEVLGDRFSSDFYDPRRFVVLVRWGEGPHLFSLIFVPLAGLFFARYLDKPSRGRLLAAAIALGLAALTNAIGLFASILLIACMAFVKFAQLKEAKQLSLKYALLTGLTSLGLVSFWFNLSFIKTFFKEGGTTTSLLISLFPWGWLVGLVALIILYLLISKYLKNFGLTSSLLWFAILFTVVAVYYQSAPGDESYRRIELLPQALRYILEVDLSLSVLIGVAAGVVINYLSRKHLLFDAAGLLCTILIFLVAFWYIHPFFPKAQAASSVAVDLTHTQEYRIAQWLQAHVDQTKGERVILPGNYSFFLNYFTNIWQLRGDIFQASTHHWPDHIYYQLSTGEDAAIARAWLTITNARYLLITQPGSSEFYQDIKQPGRFANLPMVWESNHDVMYNVPQVRPSNAKPVNIQAMKQLQVPAKGDDKEPILKYADWVDHSSQNQTSFQMIDTDHYRITGPVGPGEAILVQMTADAGWSAEQPGSGVSTGHDPLGFLVLYPKPGQVDIKLSHHSTWDQYLGYIIFLTTVVVLVSPQILLSLFRRQSIWPKIKR